MNCTILGAAPSRACHSSPVRPDPRATLVVVSTAASVEAHLVDELAGTSEDIIPQGIPGTYRFGGVATLLDSARLLLVSASRITLVDLDTGTWIEIPPIAPAFRVPSVTVLADGRVLIAGGITGSEGSGSTVLATAELAVPSA